MGVGLLCLVDPKNKKGRLARLSLIQQMTVPLHKGWFLFTGKSLVCNVI
jgi:hypothetical protein